MINAFHYSCKGESHKATDKVCQDYSLTSNQDGLTVAIVCDGHGGERYFRSDIGAKYAAEVTLEAVSLFVQHIDENLFVDQPYTAIGSTNDIVDVEQLSTIDNAFRQLFSSIIYQWNERIEDHFKTTALTEWEQEHVPQKYLDEFATASSLEKHYGCTLMAYVQTPKYWFAFHIGDGKCISFQTNPVWKEPIPWDDRCFLNKTTSLCDVSAIDEFRYCYQGDGVFPIAIVLGSDGLDDSLGETSNLANFYIQILKMLSNEGIEATEQSLKETLPQLSKIGSKDDMSVACVFNFEEVKNNIHIFIHYQLDLVNEKLYAIEQRLDSLVKRRDSLLTLKDNKSQIEYRYTLQDVEKTVIELKNYANKYNLIAAELPEGTVPPYCLDEDALNSLTQQQEQVFEDLHEDEKKKEEDAVDSNLTEPHEEEQIIIEDKEVDGVKLASNEIPETDGEE